jgi:hypothetical protein
MESLTIVERLAATKELIGGKQVAEILSFHPVTLKNLTLKRWVSAGKIPHTRLGDGSSLTPEY